MKANGWLPPNRENRFTISQLMTVFTFSLPFLTVEYILAHFSLQYSFTLFNQELYPLFKKVGKQSHFAEKHNILPQVFLIIHLKQHFMWKNYPFSRINLYFP